MRNCVQTRGVKDFQVRACLLRVQKSVRDAGTRTPSTGGFSRIFYLVYMSPAFPNPVPTVNDIFSHVITRGRNFVRKQQNLRQRWLVSGLQASR